MSRATTTAIAVPSRSRVRVSTRQYRFSLAVEDATDATGVGETMLAPGDVAQLARSVIGTEISECVLAIFLDARRRVIGYAEVARGTVNAARLAARDVFGPAMFAAAAAVAVAHNHPSGDPTPSRADRAVTNSLREAGMLMGIPLVDHVIVSADGHYSFADAGEWPQ